MKIRTLFAGLTVAAVGTMGALLVSFWNYTEANKTVATAYKSQFHSYLLADQLRQSSDDLTRLVRTYVATSDEQYKNQYNAVLDIRNGKAPLPEAYHRIYWDFVAAGDATPRPLGPTIALQEQMKQAGFTDNEFKLLDEASAKSNGLVQLEVDAMRLVEKGAATPEADRQTAISLVNSADYHRFKGEIMKPIDQFYVALEARVTDEINIAQGSASSALAFLIGSVGLLTAILLAFVGIIFYRVIRRVTGLQGAMREVAEQKLDAAIPDLASEDEIGAMAESLEVFRLAAIEKRGLEAQAAGDRASAEAERVETQLRAEADAAERLRIATSGLAVGLKRMASGDLAFQIDEPFSPDFEALRHDFNASVLQLRQALTSISDGVNTMDNSTGEISAGSNNLSKRTEQQAAALEETAAALDQITANVSSSSKRAEEARTVAIQANESARHSGIVVGNAVEAMGKIEQSSDQIANIIGVIDEIAFQTNLLALNAGVEAARAGDAGKGFAVVAQEVRELAQRSATAAKEIKDLIRNSSAEVDSGVKLVSDTGAALKAIEEYIVTINQHMEAIATSSREQSVGLSEVNTAVNQMDRVTQQNAAMVEEANAAAATLASEAGRLRGLVRQFQLGGSGIQSGRPAPFSEVASAKPVHSPARSLQKQAGLAFSGRRAQASAAVASWEEF